MSLRVCDFGHRAVAFEEEIEGTFPSNCPVCITRQEAEDQLTGLGQARKVNISLQAEIDKLNDIIEEKGESD